MMGVLHPDQDWASASILLDLWKAFEQVSPACLVQAAIRCGFLFWPAKLQVSLYGAPRVLHLDGCCSQELEVFQTVLAGDAFATGFVQLMHLQPLDETVALFGAVAPAIVVGDLVFQRRGDARGVQGDLVGATRILVGELSL
eukprot:4550909-Pyramimonas_sp.AAC.1